MMETPHLIPAAIQSKYIPLSLSRQINDKCRCGCGRIIIDDNFS